MKKICAVFFSATGTTKKVVCTVAKHLSEELEVLWEAYDVTPPKMRESGIRFSEDDIVVLGMPVYAGRVPNVLLPFVKTLRGQGTLVFPIVVYGNRSFDDALAELCGLCQEQGFRCGGAAAFVGEHAFSKTLAKGRPDAMDLKEAARFAEKAAAVIEQNNMKETLQVAGNYPSAGYFQPKRADGTPIDIRKVKPLVNENCDACKRCVSLCPMGSIVEHHVDQYQGICIKCGACVKGCHKNARYFMDPDYLYHVHDLETTWTRRAGVVMWF